MKVGKLRYSEAFYSVQGEGKFVGVPSVFLRTFGCNFRCMNFGLDRSEPMRDEKQRAGIIHNQEVQDLLNTNVHKDTKVFTDLPIIHTGCDTYASIYPEFKEFNMLRTVDEVVKHLISLLPEGKWTMDNGQDVHLIMTGGEPLLAWQRLYVELFEHPKFYLANQDRFEVTWSCSPKLSVSGEPWDTAIKPAVAVNYSHVDGSDMYLKFVVADRTDIDEAGRAVAEYRKAGIECPVYLMPLGGRSEEYNLNVQEVANICMEKGWRFTPRLHISLFGNAWGT